MLSLRFRNHFCTRWFHWWRFSNFYPGKLLPRNCRLNSCTRIYFASVYITLSKNVFFLLSGVLSSKLSSNLIPLTRINQLQMITLMSWIARSMKFHIMKASAFVWLFSFERRSWSLHRLTHYKFNVRPKFEI